MKKLFISFLVIFVFPSTAFAAAKWSIQRFDQNIELQESGNINVTETIVADFTHDEFHGLTREIPYSGGFRLTSIKDENGNPHPIFQKGFDTNKVQITIGDADKWITGLITYILTFKFDQYIEDATFKWDPVKEWPTVIEASTISIHLPKEINKEDITLSCSIDNIDAMGEGCTGELIDSKTIIFNTTKEIVKNETFGFEVKFPKNFFTKIDFSKKAYYSFIEYLLSTYRLQFHIKN